jgi:hypothetical protein
MPNGFLTIIHTPALTILADQGELTPLLCQIRALKIKNLTCYQFGLRVPEEVQSTQKHGECPAPLTKDLA